VQSIHGATLHNGNAELVRVETLITRGMPQLILVGMPDRVAMEARERLPSALRSHSFPFPKTRVLVNLVPAQVPKRGMPLDLAMAVSLLVAQSCIPAPRGRWLFLGELDLDGRIIPPERGTLLAALATEGNFAGIIGAPEVAHEAALAPGVLAFGAVDLSEVVQILLHPDQHVAAFGQENAGKREDSRLEDVRGQTLAREAAILSVAGGHPLFLQGPPGTGKSMLAKRISGLLPPLNPNQALEVARVEACLGRVPSLPRQAPLRAPHTSVSAQGVLGGGRPLRPGEISRAHHGVLFLDELPEFARPVLEGLRQPLEEGEVRLQRADSWACFPAKVLLVAARNPCPCGYLTHPKIGCQCTTLQVQRYLHKASGPLLDRFDLFVEMGPVAPEALDAPPTSPTQSEATQKIESARKIQADRLSGDMPAKGGEMQFDHLLNCGVSAAAKRRIHQAAHSLHWSGRAQLRCLRVARTIADLMESKEISEGHVLEALSFRRPILELEGAKG